MDLLEVFFQRTIQPLQARVHLMWKYQGSDDPTRVHLEELGEEAVENKLKAITRVRDNPRGSRQVLPFVADHQPNEAGQFHVGSRPLTH
ncbi:Aspartic proteinase nepenthesin-1 [Hordeum vulgare]|nr:Aspartic proteinase nepenthesin-1 [Hordeum vulgare]